MIVVVMQDKTVQPVRPRTAIGATPTIPIISSPALNVKLSVALTVLSGATAAVVVVFVPMLRTVVEVLVVGVFVVVILPLCGGVSYIIPPPKKRLNYFISV